MHIIYRTVLPILIAITAIACPTLHAQAPAAPTGHWSGLIHIPDHELRLTVDLTKSPAGVWLGSVSLVDSQAVNVPLSGITVADSTVHFDAALPDKTTFDAKLSADAKAMSGSVANLDGAVPFDLAREGEAKVSLAPPSTPLLKPFAGRWEGTLTAGSKLVRIGLTISGSTDGTAIATLRTLGQPKSETFPATTVAMTGTEIQLEARSVSGTYKGALGANGEIAGEWSQGDLHTPLTFKRVDPTLRQF